MAADKKDWAPRVGAAYRMGKATVLRAAYGVYYSLAPISPAHAR